MFCPNRARNCRGQPRIINAFAKIYALLLRDTVARRGRAFVTRCATRRARIWCYTYSCGEGARSACVRVRSIRKGWARVALFTASKPVASGIKFNQNLVWPCTNTVADPGSRPVRCRAVHADGTILRSKLAVCAGTAGSVGSGRVPITHAIHPARISHKSVRADAT